MVFPHGAVQVLKNNAHFLFVGVLIAIDNTEGTNAPILPVSNHRRTLVNTAGKTHTNIWNNSQFFEGPFNQGASSIQPFQLSLHTKMIIVDNSLFEFDTEVSTEIQDIASPTYVNHLGELVCMDDLVNQNPPIPIEKISRIPMKISAFYSIHGIYFGHRKIQGNKGKKINRKGFEESGISDCFYVYCRLCASLKVCNAGTCANFGRHLQVCYEIAISQLYDFRSVWFKNKTSL